VNLEIEHSFREFTGKGEDKWNSNWKKKYGIIKRPFRL
jgi:hypothetical protein